MSKKKHVDVRAIRWFHTGRKDGLCGVWRNISAIPRRYRTAYRKGHNHGVMYREVA